MGWSSLRCVHGVKSRPTYVFYTAIKITLFYHYILQVLKSTFNSEVYNASAGQRKLILTAAVPAGQATIDNGYDIPKLAR